MDPKEQQELLERIQDTDEEEKYPLLFTFDFQEDMEEVFHNMAAEEDLRVNAMFLGRWVDSQLTTLFHSTGLGGVKGTKTLPALDAAADLLLHVDAGWGTLQSVAVSSWPVRLSVWRSSWSRDLRSGPLLQSPALCPMRLCLRCSVVEEPGGGAREGGAGVQRGHAAQDGPLPRAPGCRPHPPCSSSCTSQCLPPALPSSSGELPALWLQSYAIVSVTARAYLSSTLSSIALHGAALLSQQ
ncbi:unnamed protein product [Boreogadus saida]